MYNEAKKMEVVERTLCYAVRSVQRYDVVVQDQDGKVLAVVDSFDSHYPAWHRCQEKQLESEQFRARESDVS